MKEFEKPGFLVLTVLEKIREELSTDTVRIIGELVEHNEAGVALDTLCSQIVEYGIELSAEHKARLKDAAFLLGIPLAQLDGLSD